MKELVQNEAERFKACVSKLLNPECSSKAVRFSLEMIGLVHKIAKSYPDMIQDMKQPFLNLFNEIMDSGDKKRIISMAKIIDEWTKAYKKNNLGAVEEEDEKVDEEGESLKIQNVKSPFDDQDTCKFLTSIIQKFEQGATNDIQVEFYNIMSNFDEAQWKALFTKEETDAIVAKSLGQMSSTPVIRAATLKLFGFIIYLPYFNQNEELLKKILQYFFDNSSDQNTNVMMRTSWALANICSITKDFTSPDTKYLVQICLNYMLSPKEKIVSNAIRAFGYIFDNVDLTKF
jgi:hypothetical protein